MTECSVHPGREANGKCEYCARPFCSACLTVFLGRRYCVACAQQVAAYAGGVTRQVGAPVAPSSAPAGVPPPPVTLRHREPLPAWLSISVYLGVFFLVVMVVGAWVTSIPAILALILEGKLPPDYAQRALARDGGAILRPATWALTMGVRAWALLMLTVVVTALCASLLERRRLAEYRWLPSGTAWRDLGIGAGLATLLFATVVGVGAITGLYQLHSNATAVDALTIILGGLLVYLPSAMIEEIAFRGYIFATAERRWGPAVAVGVSSATFALVHSWNPGIKEHPAAFVVLIMAGVYLALAYRATGTLWLPIFLHTGWNLLQGPIFGLPVSGMPAASSVFEALPIGKALWTGGRFGPEGGLLLLMVLAVHLAAFALFMPRPAPAPASPHAIPVEA